MEVPEQPTRANPAPPKMDRSDSSSGDDNASPPVPAPSFNRPRLPSRKSSGTIIVPRDSIEAREPHHVQYEMDDGAMSPRRTTEDIEALGKQARDELRMYASIYKGPIFFSCFSPRWTSANLFSSFLQARQGTSRFPAHDLQPNRGCQGGTRQTRQQQQVLTKVHRRLDEYEQDHLYRRPRQEMNAPSLAGRAGSCMLSGRSPQVTTFRAKVYFGGRETAPKCAVRVIPKTDSARLGKNSSQDGWMDESTPRLFFSSFGIASCQHRGTV